MKLKILKKINKNSRSRFRVSILKYTKILMNRIFNNINLTSK
jgi:hypothetical protein